jgi:hypothetical protein
MGKSDGFDVGVGGVKLGSFQTGCQADGTREMHVFVSNAKLHFGGKVVEGCLGGSFARASNFAGQTKVHAGPGMVRGERSTEALATFVVEEQTPGGAKELSFTQGQYETSPVATTGLEPARTFKALPWPDGCKRAEYTLSLYDVRSHLDASTSLTTIEYSSAATGFGVAIKLKNATLWR